MVLALEDFQSNSNDYANMNQQLSEHVDVELSDGSQCGETETPHMLYVTNHKLIRKHVYIRDYFTN